MAQALKPPVTLALANNPRFDDKGRMWITVNTEDRNDRGFAVASSGLQLAMYLENPTVLWVHDLTLPSVAKTEVIDRTKPGKVDVALRFAPTPFAQGLKVLYEGGFMNASSIKIAPLEVQEVRGADGLSYELWTKSLLKEISLTPVGGNPKALAPVIDGLRPEVREAMLSALGMNDETSGSGCQVLEAGKELPSPQPPAPVPTTMEGDKAMDQKQLDEAAAKAKAEAKAEAEKAASERLAAFSTAFPGRPDFALSALGKGLTLDAAKAELAGVLATEMTALRAKLTATEAELSAAKAQLALPQGKEIPADESLGAAAGVGVPPEGKDGGTKVPGYMQLVDAHQAKEKCGRAEALSAVRGTPEGKKAFGLYVKACEAAASKTV